MEMTEKELVQVIDNAQNIAYNAALNYFNDVLGGQDRYACGFAWVTTYVKGNTKLGRALLKNGFSKEYGGGLQMWNPSKFPVQNVDCLLTGAEAAAKYLQSQLGVKFYANSRLD